MEQAGPMNWKAFTIRLIEALRWPVAFVIVFALLREPVGVFIHVLAAKLSG